MRKHVKYGAVLAAAAPAIALGIVIPASATNGGGVSSAYGLAASGLINLPRTPAVSSGVHPNAKSLVSLPANPLVMFSVLRSKAVAGHSEASVVGLRIAQAAISRKAVLSAKLITARCDDGDGTSRLVDVKLAGHGIQAGASPNSSI